MCSRSPSRVRDTGMRWAGLALIAIVGACATPTTSPSGSASPALAPSLIPSVASCRLPVVVRRFDLATHTWSAGAAGFLAYPGGGLTPANATGVRYDAHRDRWLPAGLPTPDGSAYLYADGAGAVHQVGLDTGLDRVIVTGAWVPLGFVGDRLYLAQQRPVDGGGYTMGGVAQTSLSGGKPTLVTQEVGPWWLSSLGAWTTNRADGKLQAPDRVLHLDLATGAVEPWLSGVPGVEIAGFDADGHPFAVTGNIRILLVMGREDSREVYSGPLESWPEAPSWVDGGRVWFSGFGIKEPTFEAPVWLYQPGAGLQPSVGVPGAQVSVAGPCT